MDNYFERIDFTKIEIILLFGVIAVLAPWLYLQVEFDYDEEIEKIIENGDLTTPKIAIMEKFNLKEKQYDEDHDEIIEKFNDDLDKEYEKIETIKQDGIIPAPKVNVENIIENIIKKELELEKEDD